MAAKKIKKSKKKKIIVASSCLLAIALVITGFQIKASFATASPGQPNDYFSSRSTGKSIKEYTGVKTDAIIPDEYSFHFADQYSFTACAPYGGDNFATSDYPTTVDKWYGKVRDNFAFVNSNSDKEDGQRSTYRPSYG